jgi:predicted O-methyltransferase YrrM
LTTQYTAPAVISSLWADTQAAGFTMPSDPLTCTLLRTLAASKPGGQFLELGSGTGLSTAWLLDGMDARAKLTTVDNDASLLTILNRHLGHDARLKAVCADGDEFLLQAQGQQYDYVFADTWSGKYRLLDEALALVKPGGLYVIDDMLPQPNWPEGHAEKVEALLRTLHALPDWHVTQMDWASGVVIAVRAQIEQGG